MKEKEVSFEEKNPLCVAHARCFPAGLLSVVAQYCAEGLGAGDIEALIAELDRVATVINMENM